VQQLFDSILNATGNFVQLGAGNTARGDAFLADNNDRQRAGDAHDKKERSGQ